MIRLLNLALDWSEVWAPLLPLAVLLFHRPQPRFLRPVILYLAVAFFLNLTGDVIADFKRYLPAWLQNNNPLYNLHSLVRFALFSAFFLRLGQPFLQGLKKALPLVSIVFILVNFWKFENFFNPNRLSGDLLSVEAYLLLIYCLLYYLAQLRQDVPALASGPDFWVTTGLCIYVVVNFFVFLFYVPMIDEDLPLAIQIWNVHNIAYIVLCSFIAKAFYESPRLILSA